MNWTLQFVALETGVAVDELAIWVERQWLRPEQLVPDIFLNDADRARIRMIAEFRRDLAIDDEAMPVILDLVDRLHGARVELRRVLRAVSELPAAERDSVLTSIRGQSE